MELAREAWTDERLDDLVGHMDERFTRVDKDIALLRNETRSGFERADRRLDKAMHELRLGMHTRSDVIDRRFDALDRRFDALHRTMLFFYGGLVLALVGFIAAPT